MASSEFDRSSTVAKGFLGTYSDLFHIMDQGIDGELDVRRGMFPSRQHGDNELFTFFVGFFLHSGEDGRTKRRENSD